MSEKQNETLKPQSPENERPEERDLDDRELEQVAGGRRRLRR